MAEESARCLIEMPAEMAGSAFLLEKVSHAIKLKRMLSFGDDFPKLVKSSKRMGPKLISSARAKLANAYSRVKSGSKTIKTPYGPATQHDSSSSIAMRNRIQQGGTVYKGGSLGRSETATSQFLATESPLNAGYSGRYGLPPRNANFDFILTGKVRPGAPVVTRPAPGIPPNPGGGIEGVINAGDFMINSFYMP